MSLYGMMRTGVSGMNAQSTRLATVADNIANSGTNGYKRASVEFSSLITPNAGTAYTSGGVATTVRYSISQPGTLQYTTSATDLAINGNGFFTVQNSSGQPFLTRAGSFVPDGEGQLVNAAGFYLMGYNYENGLPSEVANGFAGLERVQISGKELRATPSTTGTFSANLPFNAEVVTGATPSGNAATAEFSKKTSLVVYDNVGQQKLLDVYFTKTASGNPAAVPPTQDTWEVTVYNQADAAASTSFPYAQPALASYTMTFDSNGKLAGITSGGATVDPAEVSIDLTGLNGKEVLLDMSSMTQLATEYTPLDIKVNGNAPSAIEQVIIGDDGTIYAQYANGATTALYKLPVASVLSPDQLQVLPGNVFAPGTESGSVMIGFAGEGGLGEIVSGAIENSNVDIATELTNMIESQRNYTANSKVFQTGADLMDILVNLKR